MANAADLERWVAIDERLGVDARHRRRHPERDPRGQRCGRPAADRRLAAPGPAAPVAGADDRGATHPRGGHARWLQHHLDGARAAGGRTPREPRDRRPSRRRGAPEHRPRRVWATWSRCVSVRPPRVSRRWRPHGGEPFDIVFIDADKRSNPDYLTAALRMTRPGGVDRGGQRGAPARRGGRVGPRRRGHRPRPRADG